jgi:hypothetical protein
MKHACSSVGPATPVSTRVRRRENSQVMTPRSPKTMLAHIHATHLRPRRAASAVTQTLAAINAPLTSRSSHSAQTGRFVIGGRQVRLNNGGP